MNYMSNLSEELAETWDDLTTLLQALTYRYPESHLIHRSFKDAALEASAWIVVIELPAGNTVAYPIPDEHIVKFRHLNGRPEPDDFDWSAFDARHARVLQWAQR